MAKEWNRLFQTFLLQITNALRGLTFYNIFYWELVYLSKAQV